MRNSNTWLTEVESSYVLIGAFKMQRFLVQGTLNSMWVETVFTWFSVCDRKIRKHPSFFTRPRPRNDDTVGIFKMAANKKSKQTSIFYSCLHLMWRPLRYGWGSPFDKYSHKFISCCFVIQRFNSSNLRLFGLKFLRVFICAICIFGTPKTEKMYRIQ